MIERPPDETRPQETQEPAPKPKVKGSPNPKAICTKCVHQKLGGYYVCKTENIDPISGDPITIPCNEGNPDGNCTRYKPKKINWGIIGIIAAFTVIALICLAFALLGIALNSNTPP